MGQIGQMGPCRLRPGPRRSRRALEDKLRLGPQALL